MKQYFSDKSLDDHGPDEVLYFDHGPEQYQAARAFQSRIDAMLADNPSKNRVRQIPDRTVLPSGGFFAMSFAGHKSHKR
ncbi:hypothetical protein [Parachitinimonas caeni]|uniref:Uncharacterized protein n=1 Tax=Parachitinimonas caeni TaxID=3031301 RepID=A0ABT7E151_9NEIS|nr:hypothetical protein [Parachitinimonas caeni]MDK2126049.1 hypothetical protein [Parachitinimonas caeni]